MINIYDLENMVSESKNQVGTLMYPLRGFGRMPVYEVYKS
jgi:hypothetical protein